MILIGNIEINKKEKNGKMLIAIPFWNKTEFYVSINNKKEKDSQPDFLIWSNRISFGGLWKKSYEKEGEEKKYLSGSLFAPGKGLDGNKLKLVIFETKTDDESVFKGSVFYSEDKKEIDTESDNHIINTDDGIF